MVPTLSPAQDDDVLAFLDSEPPRQSAAQSKHCVFRADDLITESERLNVSL